MKGKILLLTINAFILVYWIVTGTYRAAYEPSWVCTLDGAAITIYALLVYQNIMSVIKAVKSRKK